MLFPQVLDFHLIAANRFNIAIADSLINGVLPSIAMAMATKIALAERRQARWVAL